MAVTQGSCSAAAWGDFGDETNQSPHVLFLKLQGKLNLPTSQQVHQPLKETDGETFCSRKVALHGVSQVSEAKHGWRCLHLPNLVAIDRRTPRFPSVNIWICHPPKFKIWAAITAWPSHSRRRGVMLISHSYKNLTNTSRRNCLCELYVFQEHPWCWASFAVLVKWKPNSQERNCEPCIHTRSSSNHQRIVQSRQT